jgi:hypothetical protein
MALLQLAVAQVVAHQMARVEPQGLQGRVTTVEARQVTGLVAVAVALGLLVLEEVL